MTVWYYSIAIIIITGAVIAGFFLREDLRYINDITWHVFWGIVLTIFVWPLIVPATVVILTIAIIVGVPIGFGALIYAIMNREIKWPRRKKKKPKIPKMQVI